MDVPALPTDNLYKFVALAGIALAGYSVTFPQLQLFDLERQLIHRDVESRIIGLELDSIKSARDRIPVNTDHQAALTQFDALLARNLELAKKAIEQEGKGEEQRLLLSKID